MRYKIKEFNGCFSRVGEIWVEYSKCEICGEEKLCISFDGSEGEYTYVYLCSDCVTLAINKIANESLNLTESATPDSVS